MKLPFNNPKPVQAAIVLLILSFLAYMYFNQAEAGEFEAGPTFTGEFNGGAGIVYSERVLNDKLDIGVQLISEQSWDDKQVGNNGGVWTAFIAHKPERWWRVLPDELSIGASYWIKTDEHLIGCNLGYQLGFRWRFGQWSIGPRHWSNAGTCKPNRGQDMLTIGFRFR